MKYFVGTLLLSFFMNGSASAGCFRPFTMTAIASSELEALQKIRLEAVRRCGEDDFQWAHLSKFFGSHEVEMDGEVMIKAQAEYQCCFAW